MDNEVYNRKWQNMPRAVEKKMNPGATKYLGVFRYGARALRLIWSTNKTLSLFLALFTLMTGTIPAAAAYVGKLVVDGVVLAAGTSDLTDRNDVLFWVGIEGLLILALAMAQRGADTSQTLLRAILGHRIITMIFEKAMTLQLENFEDPEVHDKMLQARNEAVSRPVALVTGTFGLIRDALSLCTYGWLLFQFSGWAVVVIAAAGLPAFLVELRFSGVAFRFLLSKTPETRVRKYLEAVITREDFAKETLVFRLGKKIMSRYNDLFWRLYRRDRQIQLQRGFWGFILGAVSTIALYGAYLWIILSAIAGQLTIGEMTMYLVLFRQGQAAVTSALAGIGGMYENNLYLSNLFSFLELDVPDSEGTATEGTDAKEGLRFENVTFTYPDATHPALEEVSFELRPGHQLALVGENGSGKTTLVKLLARLYEPDSGSIFLHGRNIKDWDVESLRQKIAIVFQDFVQYRFTVGENIAIGDVDHFDDREAWARAAKLGLLDEEIEKFPKQYDTQLGKAFKGGYELSGGQWQRLALSRLFMRQDAEIYVLDEPTAAVDARAEAEVFEHVRRTADNRMCVLISHRLSFSRSADEIIVLAGGEIVERGSHEQLMELGGTYSELFELQASGYHD